MKGRIFMFQIKYFCHFFFQAPVGGQEGLKQKPVFPFLLKMPVFSTLALKFYSPPIIVGQDKENFSRHLLLVE